MSKNSNPQARRVNRVRRALVESHYLEPGRTPKESKQSALRDLLADVRPYCDAHRIDFAQADRTAQDHHAAESHPFKISEALAPVKWRAYWIERGAVIEAFWAENPQASIKRIRSDDGHGFHYVTDTRVAFVDWLDNAERSGRVSSDVAQTVTLED
jgi:hypothetical protein